MSRYSSKKGSNAVSLFTEMLFSFPCYLFVVLGFNQVNYVPSNPLLPVSSHLGSEFCFRRFCTSILRIFRRSHAKPCVCVHACVYFFRQHNNNSNNPAKSWLCFRRTHGKKWNLLLFSGVFSFWPKRARHPYSWQNVFTLKCDYFENAHTYGFISSLLTGSL